MKKLGLKMKAIGIIASVILMVRPLANAQTDSTKKSTIDFTTGVDLYSRYLWRGAQIGTAPAIQPTIKATFKNLTIGAWGSAQFDGTFPETDLFVTYVLPLGLSITVNDYFISPTDGTLGDFSEYDPDRGSYHQIEGCLGYTGPEKFPISALIGYTFYGAEWSKTATTNMNTSLYAELSYPVKKITFILGAGNKYYTYSDKEDFSLINVGAKVVKTIEVTDKFSLPVIGQLMYNPTTKCMLYTVGISL